MKTIDNFEITKASFIALKGKNGKWRHYAVDEEIYNYIKQLEMCIKFPKESKLKELYPERFK